MSGNKKTILRYPVISSGDMSGNLTSSVTNNQFLDSVCYQVSWTGSPVGVFSAQVSIDYAQSSTGEVLNAGTWTTLTLSYFNGAATITANSIPTSLGSPVFIDLTLLSAPWVRLIYVAASGSGSLTACVSAKAIG